MRRVARTGWLLLLCLGACQVAGDAKRRAAAAEDRSAGLASPPPATDALAGAFFADGAGDVSSRAGNSFGQPAAADRMLIQTATLALEVARPADTMAEFIARIQVIGGYVSSMKETQVVVRVPAAQLDAVLGEIRKQGRVLAESRQAQDVTKDHFDLGLRLDTAKKARDRLVALLDKAVSVKEMLEIEKELRRLLEEIERMEGEQRFLQDQVAMSTLQVVFRAVAETPVLQRQRVASRFSWLESIGAEQVQEGF